MSKFSRISRMDFSEKTPFPKDPFSEPEFHMARSMIPIAPSDTSKLTNCWLHIWSWSSENLFLYKIQGNQINHRILCRVAVIFGESF